MTGSARSQKILEIASVSAASEWPGIPCRAAVLYGALILCLGLAPAARATPVTIGVACGSAADIQLTDGSIYWADQEYTGNNEFGALGGYPFDPGFPVINDRRSSREMRLFAQQRVGPAGYAFEVENGLYELTLHIATLQRDCAGISPMTVLAESDTLVVGFDAVAEAGKGRPVEFRALVSVEDDVLDLEFQSAFGDHDLAAIGVRLATPGDLLPPEAPGNLTALGTYGGALLWWERSLTTDLDGYRVLAEEGDRWTVIAEKRWSPLIVVSTEQRRRYGVLAIDLYGNPSDTVFSAAVAPRLPDAAELPRYELGIAPSVLDSMCTEIFVDVENSSLLVIDDQPYPDVSVSFRGSDGTRNWPKKSWNINLRDNPNVHGGDRLALRANWEDPTVQRELLTLNLMEQIGAEASIAFPVLLAVNGEHAGVHVDVEKVDEHLLERVGWNPQGRLYRVDSGLAPYAGVAKYRERFEESLTGDWERGDIVELVEGISNIPDADFLPWIESRLDLEQYLNLICHEEWSANTDWVSDDYYLYRSDSDSLWKVIPWDMGESWFLEDVSQEIYFGTEDAPRWGVEWNRLLDRVLAQPSLRRRYTEKLREFGAGHLATDSILATFQRTTEAISDEMNRDVGKRTVEIVEFYEREVADVETFILARSAEIDAQLVDYEPPEHVWVRIAELISAEDGQVDQVEILNLAPRPFDFRGFYLSDDRGDTTKWPLDQVTIAARGREMFPLPTPVATGGWLGLARNLDGGEVAVMVDSLELPTLLLADRSLGRYPEGSERWRYSDVATPGQANEWSTPIQIDFQLDPQVISPGQVLEILLDLTNREPVNLSGRIEILLSTFDGIQLGGGSVLSRSIVVPAQGTKQVVFRPIIPTGMLEPYGYVVTGRFVVGRDDEWSRGASELFIVGDPDTVLMVNELMAVNDATIADEFGEFDDWVELLNLSEGSVSLEGLYLTDDFEEAPFKWRLPAVDLDSGERLIIWCDNDIEQGPYHASFKLSGNGEGVAIVRDGGGGTPEALDQWRFGRQTADVSLGRFPDGQPTWVVLDSPSPGDINQYQPY